MLSFLRQFFRFCIQAKYEGTRTYEAVLDILKNVPKSSSLLDIGCADGINTMQYIKMLAVPLERVYGIELKPKFVRLAKKRCLINGVQYNMQSNFGTLKKYIPSVIGDG